MKLSIFVLNVGHGSSIVLEHADQNGDKYFGLIDCNNSGDGPPRALEKLHTLGAKKLAFVALTHPHKDHFRGLSEIITAFKGGIEQFYSCPFGELLQNRSRLKKLSQNLQKIVSSTDGMAERKAALELGRILMWAYEEARQQRLEWRECKGEENTISPPGFGDVDLKTILPPGRAIGNFVQRVIDGDMTVGGHFDDNQISLAFQISYGGNQIVLGGDGTVENWTWRRRFEKNSKRPLDANAVNLPHHGSGLDCPPDVLEQLFSGSGSPKYGLTSANGISHPSETVIKWMEDNDVHPYCTNLMPICGANAQRLLVLQGLEAQLAKWIREVASSQQSQPCQGDVAITMEKGGHFAITPEYSHPCAFRGDFDALLGI